MNRRFLPLLVLLPLAVAACIPKGVRVPQSPLLGALERKSGTIAYVGFDGNIYTTNQGGGGQEAITEDASLPEDQDSREPFRFYRYPTWSPNSQRLAFAGISGSNGTASTGRLYIAEPGKRAILEIYSSGQLPVYLYWTPDSQQVSFLRNEPSGQLSLQMVPAGGGQAQVLDVGQPFYWHWAPNGRQLLTHVEGTADTARLSILSLEEPVVEEVLEVQPAVFQAPAWSPDGSQLLLAAQTESGETALTMADNRGQSQQTLATLEEASFTAFAWSPDGRRIAYLSAGGEATQARQGKLTVLDPADPGQVVSTEEEAVTAFFWSPDSKKIAYFVQTLILPSGSGSEEGDGSEDTTQEPIPVLHLHILDVAEGESIEVFGPFVTSRQFAEVLSFFDQYHRSATIWSPNSENIVVPIVTSEQAAIVVVAASGSLQPRRIADGFVAFWSWK